ncbi:MAG: SRPBCC family protein [Actinomycetota bacterium]|nr:SRPBCC family protein [Actinomycetota bacterium]
MSSESRHISMEIHRTAGVVYDYVSDPRHLPEWAAGLSGSIERVEEQWVAQSPMGPVTVAFAATNDYGVLDHDVTLPSGETVSNRMRVIPDGDDSEVVFTLRRGPGMTEDAFQRDADAIAADLDALKRLLEGR